MKSEFPPGMCVAREGNVTVLANRVRPVRAYANGRSRVFPRQVWCTVSTMFPTPHTRARRGHFYVSFGCPIDPDAKPSADEFLKDPVHADYRDPRRRFVLFGPHALLHARNDAGEPVFGFSANEMFGDEKARPLDYHINGSSYARIIQALLGPDDGGDLPSPDLDLTCGPDLGEE